MKAHDIIAAFGAVEDDTRNGYRAACPVHEKDGVGHKPSLILDFNATTRKALILCESRRCSADEVLVSVGLSRRDLSDVSYIGQSVRSMTGAARKAPATGDARALIGATAYRYASALADHVVAEPDGPVAALLASRYGVDVSGLNTDAADALGVGLNDDGWISIAARAVSGEVAFVQYRNPDPLAEIRWSMAANPDDRTRWDAAGFVGRRHPDRTVIVTEGMSDGLTVAAIGEYDVVSIRGAANAARVNEVSSELVGRVVALVIDNDEAGRNMTKRLLASLSPVAASISYVKLPDGYDVGDYRADNPETFRDRLAGAVAGAVEYAPGVEFDFTPHLGMTDHDNAEAIVAYAKARGLRLAHTASHGWLIYDGTVWVPRADSRVRQLAGALGKYVRQVAGAALSAGSEDRATLYKKFTRGFLMAAGVDRALRVAETLPGVLADAADFDAHPDLLGVGNGVVDLRTGVLRPMKPEDRITKRLAVNYDPAATAPRWDKFLTEIFVDEDGNTARDVVDYVQGLIGYGATGHTSEQCFTVLNGSGSNAKSTFVGILGEVFGEISVATPFSTFEEKKSGGIPNDLAALKGARFVMANESDVNQRMSEATLKAVTGEDVIAARFMRAEFFTFKPSFLLFLVSNHLPRFIGQDDGIWRRVRLIEFRRKFLPHEQDRGLGARIASEEAEGVLAWTVEGAKAWYANGRRLAESPTIVAASQGYREDSDALGPFLAANTVETGNRREVIFQQDLHERFLGWQDATNEPLKPGQRQFATMMNERWGKPHKDAYPRHWKGRRLLSEAEVLARVETARRELTGDEGPALRLLVPPAVLAEKYAHRYDATPIDAPGGSA